MKLPSSKAMTIGFVAFTILVVLLIVYGWATHEEPGLLPDAPQWGHAPLIVFGQAGLLAADGLAIEESETRALAAAMQATNERLGFTMFRPEADIANERIDVLVTFRVPVGDDGCERAGGNVTIETDPSGPFCTVLLCNTGTSELEQLTIQHELAHCLGLADEKGANPQSIMADEQTPTPRGELPRWISDSDRAILRRLYAP